jgi:hypothetical protein
MREGIITGLVYLRMNNLKINIFSWNAKLLLSNIFF